MSGSVHPTAIIDPNVVIAEDVAIGPYAIVEAGVSIASGCRLAAHAVVRKNTVLEKNVSVDSFAVIGGPPQDLVFSDETTSSVQIGKGTVIREGVTINPSTDENGVTRVGEGCYLMANAHVAHDCQIGDRVILANNAMLAGHVHVGDGSFLGGGCGIHQYVNIGKLVMVAGNASITLDVPSYVMVAERSVVTGLNLVGLKRALGREAISELRDCYKAVYMKAGAPAKLASVLEGNTDEAKEFLSCFESSRRKGFSRSRIQG